ncbi:hypothetical protein BGW36DRAFT_368629 [Talaromyces proteolyticus]|uniref:BZIP domain-containing protein n=1 Tax=Talaromyces proteolyticus TaxID=1131652 RepID=A0AAD4L4X8_9EURO|nr:uncharacterized protein BGW36DRAFT_368629 [Talaromyces proteolyticus]KAH8706042.1 hypothetical protein BGW36DRAFT_368629 [Talaromyces proteolyticus]
MSKHLSYSLEQVPPQNNCVADEFATSRQHYNQLNAYVPYVEPASQQYSGLNAVTRRRIQNRDAARKYRSNRSTITNERPSQTYATHNEQSLPKIRNRAIQPRPSQKVFTSLSEEFPAHRPPAQTHSAYADSAASGSSHDENILLTPPKSTTSSSSRLSGRSQDIPDEFHDMLVEKKLLSHLDSGLADLNKVPPSIEAYGAVSWPNTSHSDHYPFMPDSTSGNFSMTWSDSRERWPTSDCTHPPVPAESRQNPKTTASFTLSYVDDPTYATPHNDEVLSSHDDSDGDENYQTSLHIAAKCGHESMIDMLLKSSIAVDHPDSEGNTPLHVAVLGRNLVILQRLLECGADPNIRNLSGWTPVHLAVQAGSVDAVRMLVSYGGDLGKKARRNV